ncbi:MAG: hypothetical protein ACI4XM_02290 [Candidatus Coprovivens sp.]
MYKINDIIIYKREVCIINKIKNNYYNGKDYYSVSPISDKTLTLNIPTDSPQIKNLLTKKEALNIIEKIPTINEIKADDKSLENIYKELLSTDKEEDLVKIIKTTYLRNKKRVDSGKKIGDKDDIYFKKAESLLYNSLATSLNMTFNECKEYIINHIDKKEVR